MTRTPFTPVQAGEALNFSATEHNAFIRTALRSGNGVGQVSGKDKQHVWLQNTITGPAVAVEAGDVVRITDEIPSTAFQNKNVTGIGLLQRAFEFAEPASSDPLNSTYAIATQQMAAATTDHHFAAPGIVVGIATATVDVQLVTHKYAIPRTDGVGDGFTLVSTTDPMAPYQIVGTPAGTGLRSVNVWQKGISTVIRAGVVTEAVGIASGGSGSVEIRISGSAEIDPDGGNHEVTAYHDWFLGDSITNSRKVLVAYFPDDNKWRIIAAECEPVGAPAPPGHGDAITALGTDRDTAQGLSFRVNRVDTINAGVDDGVRLPATFEQGDDCFVQNNHGSATLNIYAATGDKIDSVDGATAATLAAGGSAHFFLVQSDEWVT